MSDAKHSPTPWTIADFGVVDGNNDPVTLSTFPGFGGQATRGRANREFALRAVNLHDDLVSVLEGLLGSRNITDCPGGRWSTADHENYSLVVAAAAVLARAKIAEVPPRARTEHESKMLNDAVDRIREAKARYSINGVRIVLQDFIEGNNTDPNLPQILDAMSYMSPYAEVTFLGGDGATFEIHRTH